MDDFLKKRDSAIFYRSFYESIKELPESNQLEIYNAIFELSFNFNEVELTGISKTIFKLIKPQIEANLKRYLNGSKAKTTSTESKPEANPKQDTSKIEAEDNQQESKPEANKNKNENKNLNDNKNGFANALKLDYIPFLQPEKKKSIIKENATFNFDGFLSLEVEAINLWLEYKTEKKQSYTKTGLTGLRNKLLKIKESSSIIDAINNSIANGYNGIFEVKQSNNYQSTQSNKILDRVVEAYLDSVSNRLCAYVKDKYEPDEIIAVICPEEYTTPDKINEQLQIWGSRLRYNDLKRYDTNEYTKDKPYSQRIMRREPKQNV